MASPPFSLSTSTPGDSDIVSQFPLDERTLRDIIQSWLLIDHNNLGNHVKVTMPWGTPPATPLASTNAYYTNPDGNLAVIDPTGSARYVGPPVGSVFFHTTATPPVGYLIADGSAVSRATFSALFAAIGTTYGAGNGSTTFNLPNITGRVIAGVDNAGVTLNAAGLGTTAIIAAVGGSQVNTLTLAQIPTGITSSGSNTINVTPPSGRFVITSGNSTILDFNPQNAAGFRVGDNTSTNTQAVFSGNNTIGVTSNNTSGNAHPNVQPTIVLLPVIKY